MQAYADALLIAIPFFIFLLMIEMAYSKWVKKTVYRPLDTISSLSSGLTNIIKDSLGLVLVLISYPFLVEHLALFNIESTWLVYVIAFVAMDFASYWNHRLNHKINFFWNQHVIHHSSEEFNLACALRQPISNVLGYFSILLIPAALFGVPHQVIAVIAPLHLFAQFWYHTQHIGKLGILEYVLVTPSQHRVHHAINKEYIDKNLAAIFCVWDRAFGTFQEELDDVPPVYGILKPARTWNPFLINFQHLWSLCLDAWRTNNWIDKFKIWFMPTGWRPADVAHKFPRTVIVDPYNFKKYGARVSVVLIYWSTFQLIANLVLLLFMFYNFEHLSTDQLLMYGLLVGLGVYTYTSLMDGSKQAMISAVLYAGISLFIIYQTSDWFGLNSYSTNGHIIVGVYFILTIVCTTYFSLFERGKTVDPS